LAYPTAICRRVRDIAAADPAASKASFPAVADTRTRLLILGSLPGEASLARGQYYAHPQNQFWRLLERVIGYDLAASPYSARLEDLRASGVGLWDVIRTARRVGSLDADIRGHEPNPLAGFIATLPALRAIAFNGGKAAEIGRRQISDAFDGELITLPSSSPAHTRAFDEKLAVWLELRRFLGPSA
jgi:TDG/mug DNA glycosylase family protein